MRDASRYRGARRAYAKHLFRDAPARSFVGVPSSFVDFWRGFMPQDSAASIRASDWRRYTDKKERTYASRKSAA